MNLFGHLVGLFGRGKNNNKSIKLLLSGIMFLQSENRYLIALTFPFYYFNTEKQNFLNVRDEIL
jgi:hypothetical protein